MSRISLVHSPVFELPIYPVAPTTLHSSTLVCRCKSLYAPDLAIRESDFDPTRMVASGQDVRYLTRRELPCSLVCLQDDPHANAFPELGHFRNGHSLERTS